MTKSFCSVEVCDRPTLARGLCSSHYRRWQTNGKPGDTAIRPLIHGGVSGPCSVEGCKRERKVRGFCDTHYSRYLNHGDAGVAAIGKYRAEPCTVDGCERLTTGQGLCPMHYERKRRGRDVGAAESLRRTTGEGTITNGYRKITVAKGEQQMEHRFLMERLLGRPLVKGETVHHVNGDRADNTVSDTLDERYRSGNLELWSTWQPAGQRVIDKIKFAEELLRRYRPYRQET